MEKRKILNKSENIVVDKILSTTKIYVEKQLGLEANKKNLMRFLISALASAQAHLEELNLQRHLCCGGKNISHRRMYQNITEARWEVKILNMAIVRAKKSLPLT